MLEKMKVTVEGALRTVYKNMERRLDEQENNERIGTIYIRVLLKSLGYLEESWRFE